MTPPRVVLVTGASSGIGRATALRAAARGDHVVLVARGPHALGETELECERAGAASTLVVPADVSVDPAVENLVQRVVDAYDRIDVVAHCAGVVAYGTVPDVPVEVFDQVLATNLRGSANVARHVVPVLRRQGHGSLVLVGSVIGHVAVPGMTAYAVSKWGVRSLARQLRLENRDLPGVRIGYVAPGGVDTPIYEQAANYGGALGRPPFPVATPDTVARRVLAVAGRRVARSQVGAANDVMRLGFTTLPRVYDMLVGPLFRVAAQDRTRAVVHGPGNVLATQEGANRLRGGWSSALVGVVRNLQFMRRSRTGRAREGVAS